METNVTAEYQTTFKQLPKKQSCQSVISSFLKLLFLLIVVFSWGFCIYCWGLFLIFICSDSDDYIYYLYWLFSTNYFRGSLGKTCSFYIWRVLRKTKGIYLLYELNFFFSWSFENLSSACAQIKFYIATF